MIFSKEIAQKVLTIIINDTENDYDKLREVFANDPIWYVIALACHWNNDLQYWCEAVLIDETDKFFCDKEINSYNELS